MAGSYFYEQQGVTHGPLSSRELRERAASGQLLRTDLVWREGSPKRVPAGQIDRLFSASNDATTPAPKPDLSVVQTAAALATQQARLQSLRWDLQRADEQLGAAAAARQLGQTECAPLYEALRELAERLTEKQQAVVPLLGESVAAQAKRLASQAKRKVEVEGLLAGRAKLYRQLGARLRELPALVAALPELPPAQRLAAEIARCEAELAAIGPAATRLRRRGLWIGGAAAALVVLYAFSGFFLEWWRDRNQYAYLAEVARQTAAEQERLNAELLELERQKAREKAQQEARQRLAETQARLDREKQQAESERRARERAQAEQDRKAALAERQRQEQLAAEKARMQAAAAEEAEQRQRQRELVELAQREFSAVSLDVTRHFYLCQSLHDLGATLELRGPKSREIVTAFENEDWPTLINLVRSSHDAELASAGQIERGVAALRDYPFRALLNVHLPSTKSKDPRGLYLIRFEGADPDEFRDLHVAETEITERHPDGKGYLLPWSPKNELSAIVWTPEAHVEAQLERWNRELANRNYRRKELVRLGELDTSAAEEDRQAMLQELYEQVIDWASGL